MLLKVFKLLIDSLFLHLEALVVFQFILSPLILYFINEFLILTINELDVLDPSDFHLLEQIISVFDELLRLLAEDV